MLAHPVLLSYKKIQMAAASRDQVQLAQYLNAKHDEGSPFDVFKRKKYYFKLYMDRLEAFHSAESSIGAPKFTIYPGEETVIEQLNSAPNSIKVHSKDVKIIIETKSGQMQSEWLQHLTDVFKGKTNSTSGCTPEVSKENAVETTRDSSSSDFRLNLSKEIYEIHIKKKENKSNTCYPKIILPAVADENFFPTAMRRNITPSKIGSSEENSKPNVKQQSNFSTATSKLTLPEGNARINRVQSQFPLNLKILQTNEQKNLLMNTNRKGSPIETSYSISPPMSSLPPIKPLGQRPHIVPSDDQYDELEEYDTIEEEAIQNTSPTQAVKEKNSLQIIPVRLSRVLYGCHGWPLVLRFKDGKISLLKECGTLIVNWDFKHIRKFKCKADLFFFETGHKYPGGSKHFEFQLVEKVSQKSINDISEMIYQEMKQVSAGGSKKIKNQTSEENLLSKASECGISVPPSDIRRSYFNVSDVMQTPAVPPPFTSKPKMEVKKSNVIIIPSDDLYDELVDYDGLEEEEPTEELTLPLLPVSRPPNDGAIKHGFLWEHSPPSLTQHSEVRESPSTSKNKQVGGNTSTVENFSEPRRYKGPIDNSLYAFPSQC